MSTNAQELILSTDTLTQKQEDFARWYVEYRNATTAYRQVYDVAPTTKPASVYRQAHALLHHPDVAARIKELRALAESETVMRARELFGDLLDIASADPNKLSSHRSVNCRHCHGEEYREQCYEYEWAVKTAEAYAIDQPGPTVYDPTLAPVLACPHCYGAGVHVAQFGNTDELDPRTRKLYKGTRIKGDGSIEILMHDQADARKELAKIMGIYADGKGRGIDLTAPPAELASNATAEDAASDYLAMVR